jgi:hypothetical protein
MFDKTIYALSELRHPKQGEWYYADGLLVKAGIDYDHNNNKYQVLEPATNLMSHQDTLIELIRDEVDAWNRSQRTGEDAVDNISVMIDEHDENDKGDPLVELTESIRLFIKMTKQCVTTTRHVKENLEPALLRYDRSLLKYENSN